MIRVVGYKDAAKYPNTINITTRGKDWGRQLSPMLLGPVHVYGEHYAQNVENAWQFSKVYKRHVGEDGWPTEEYWDWATKGWIDSFAHRCPMGRGAVPEYSLYRGKQLGYIEARKQIYVPLYKQAIKGEHGVLQTSPAYQKLLRLASETDVALLDFDAYDHVQLGMTLNEVLNDQSKKMGHAFVLAMMLEEDLDRRF